MHPLQLLLSVAAVVVSILLAEQALAKLGWDIWLPLRRPKHPPGYFYSREFLHNLKQQTPMYWLPEPRPLPEPNGNPITFYHS
jgi:hypothetical protein